MTLQRSLFDNQIGRRQGFVKTLIIAISLAILAISLVLFSLCVTKPYMGVVLSLGDKGWMVENIDRHGTAFSAGIEEGDMPTKINDQPASLFLGKYEKTASIRLIEQLEVINPNGQTFASDIRTDAQSENSFFEIGSWFVLSAAFFLTGIYIFLKKPNNIAALLLLLCGSVLALSLSSTLAAERLIPLAAHLSVIAPLVGPWLLLHFFLILPEERANLRHDSRIFFIYMIPALALIAYPILGYANGQPLPEFRMFRLFSYGLGFLGVMGIAIYNYVRARLPQAGIFSQGDCHNGRCHGA
jgi:hypothetical protein